MRHPWMKSLSISEHLRPISAWLTWLAWKEQIQWAKVQTSVRISLRITRMPGHQLLIDEFSALMPRQRLRMSSLSTRIEQLQHFSKKCSPQCSSSKTLTLFRSCSSFYLPAVKIWVGTSLGKTTVSLLTFSLSFNRTNVLITSLECTISLAKTLYRFTLSASTRNSKNIIPSFHRLGSTRKTCMK